MSCRILGRMSRVLPKAGARHGTDLDHNNFKLFLCNSENSEGRGSCFMSSKKRPRQAKIQFSSNVDF